MRVKSAIRNPQSEMDNVHIYSVSVDSADCGRLTEFLSPDELDRAARFHFPRDRDRFIARRGILREILSRCLDQAPGDLQFQYTPLGKPYLAGTPIHFSASHSNALALCAVSSQEVGIDVEQICPDFPFMEVARRFFREAELSYLESLPPADQRRSFYALWTRKEAYLKALGLGLSAGIEAPIPLASDAEITGPEGKVWTVLELDVGADYRAALACAGGLKSARIHPWTPDRQSKKPLKRN